LVKKIFSYKKAAIIYNPQAGAGIQLSPLFLKLVGIRKLGQETFSSKQASIEKVKEYLSKYGIDAQILATQHAGHATTLAKDLANRSYDLVVAAGGDGTINEVINGIATSNTVLGIIPLGTANVLAMELNIPIEIDAACQLIASGNSSLVDLGQANGRYFACMVGIGFDAHVLNRADSKLKRIMGILSYPMIVLWELMSYRFRLICLKIDDSDEIKRGYYVIVGNSKYYAGETMITHLADMKDGYLDVCIFKHKSIFHILAYIFSIWSKNIDKNMGVEYLQCKKISVLKKGKHAIHVDAEYLCNSSAAIQICPKALLVVEGTLASGK